MSAFVINRPNIRAIALCVTLCCLAAAVSCAYFNTLYNARRIYREAEERREAGTGGEREMRDSYKEVVTKCAKVVRDYPNSRWVDDALFLMGKALVRQGEIDKGIRKFIELLTNFPKSDYVPKSIYWLGLSYYEKGDYNQALVYTDRFLKEHPKNELRTDVMFLAGDVHRELEQDEEALSFYSRVAEESSDGDVVDEATLKTAELFYAKEDWERAAAAYSRVLRKGIPWRRKYEISLSLGECYARTGRCRDALDVYNGLLEEIVSAKEKPSVELGRGESYVCMDSLDAALSIFESVTGEFPRSSYSAEAYYRIGTIYQERLDSLGHAQKAFSKVAGEYANSPFAESAIQKSTSIKRLMELDRAEESDAGSAERLAEKRFLAAEIQLTRLDEVDVAVSNYSAVVDSFPGTSYAPKAAFAVAWIYDSEKKDRDRAVEMYRRVITLYPRSPQARGAIERLGTLGALELRQQMQAVIDSAIVDTTGPAPDSIRTTIPDTTAALPSVPAPTGPSGSAHEDDSTAAVPDTTVIEPADTAGARTN